MDLARPGISGLVASSALRKLLPRVPIILFTLYAGKLLEIEAAKAGVSVVLSKTAPLRTLMDIANEMIGGQTDSLAPAKAAGSPAQASHNLLVAIVGGSSPKGTWFMSDRDSGVSEPTGRVPGGWTLLVVCLFLLLASLKIIGWWWNKLSN